VRSAPLFLVTFFKKVSILVQPVYWYLNKNMRDETEQFNTLVEAEWI